MTGQLGPSKQPGPTPNPTPPDAEAVELREACEYFVSVYDGNPAYLQNGPLASACRRIKEALGAGSNHRSYPSAAALDAARAPQGGDVDADKIRGLLHRTYAALDIRELINCIPEAGEVWPTTGPLDKLREAIGDVLFPEEAPHGGGE